MTPFSNSYIITNRNTPSATAAANIYPLPNNELWFYTAPSQYDPEVNDYTAVGPSSQTASPAFLTALVADLQVAIDNGFPQLTLLIHGLGNTFGTSINELSILGNGMQQFTSYYGLTISFDWPSFDSLDSAMYYSATPYSFPRSQTSGTIRGNINGSVGAFANLITMLFELQAKLPSLELNLISHSEGNYMAMLGLNAAFNAKTALILNQVLLVAADINSGALQVNGSQPYTGQGIPISTLANSVTIYYSNNDDVLPLSQQDLASYHNPSFLDRLGLGGPNNFDNSALPSNTFGVDCSAVISEPVIAKIPQVPPGTTSHSSYFYIPQVLGDWAETMMGNAESAVENRTANANAQDGQGFIMNLVAPTTTPLRRGRGVLKRVARP